MTNEIIQKHFNDHGQYAQKNSFYESGGLRYTSQDPESISGRPVTRS